MNLFLQINNFIEDVQTLKKEGWRRDDTKNYSGTQGVTTKWQKEHPDGAKSTIFNKAASSDVDSIFGVNAVLSTLFNEIAARKIINMINVAGKAYGYGNSLYPIPKINEYTIKYIPEKKNLQVHFVNSSFHQTAELLSRNTSQHSLVNDYINKLFIFNVMLGNRDAHEGNFAVNANKKRIYAIDLGSAFTSRFEFPEVADTLATMRKKISGDSNKTINQEKKIAAKFITFLELFIEHNEDNMLLAIDDTTKEMSKNIAQAVLKEKPSEEIEKITLDVIGMFQTTVDNKKKKLKENIAVVKNFIKLAKGLLK